MDTIDPKGHDPKLVAALASLVKRLEATPEELRGPFLVNGLKPYFPAQSLRSQAGVSEAVAWRWNEGAPPKPFRDEWFIAKTIHGDRVVLTALPEEWTYDYKTADETYIMAKNIKSWMQFPDSQFVPFARPDPIEITEAAERAFKDGLAYGSNVRNADPDIAWGHSAIRAALEGETK